MTSPTASSALPSVLRYRDVRLFLVCRFFSGLGVNMLTVAVGWQIYDITRDPLALGYVGLAVFLPMAALTLPAGDIADRVDRRLVLAAACIGEAASAVLLLVLTLAEPRGAAPFYAVLALLVVVDALPFLVDKQHTHTNLEHLPGLWSVFGFVACTLIIFLSKWYGHAGIMKREDYYDE